MSEEKKEHWLYKGDGGEWFEPYVTNKDIVRIAIIMIIGCLIIILGCSLI